jgi:hypothetical protein
LKVSKKMANEEEMIVRVICSGSLTWTRDCDGIIYMVSQRCLLPPSRASWGEDDSDRSLSDGILDDPLRPSAG